MQWLLTYFIKIRAGTLCNYLKSCQISAKAGPKQRSLSMCVLWSLCISPVRHFVHPLQHCSVIGREPWPSGYGRRLTFERSWVRFPAQDTGWTWHFFTLICCKNCIVCLKRPKINEKEARVGPFFKKNQSNKRPAVQWYFPLWWVDTLNVFT